jgi:hypothetical protein
MTKICNKITILTFLIAKTITILIIIVGKIEKACVLSKPFLVWSIGGGGISDFF